MTDVSGLDDLAAKIASGKYPNIARYAKAQAAATQSQETDIRKLLEDVEMLKRSVSPPPDGGVPPGPGGSGAQPVFDGRAIKMTSLTGSTVYDGSPGWAGSSNATQTPHMWGLDPDDIASGLYFMYDDIRLVADGTYTQVYLYEIGQDSRNPYWSDGTSSASELTRERSVAMGDWDWYTVVFKLQSPLTFMNWHVLAQFGYPALSSPPLSVSFENPNLGIDRHVGEIPTGQYLPAIIDKPRFYSVASILDKWVELVVGVKWAQDETGEVHVYGRCAANGETSLVEKVTRTNVITVQWREGSSPLTSVNDKQSFYFGDGSTRPTNRVLHRGIVRWATQADAFASLG